MRQQQLAGFGRRRAAPVAHQQALVQLNFKQPHLPAECRLRHIKRNRGAGKAAKFGNAYKIFKLFEVHCLSLLP